MVGDNRCITWRGRLLWGSRNEALKLATKCTMLLLITNLPVIRRIPILAGADVAIASRLGQNLHYVRHEPSALGEMPWRRKTG